MSSSHYISALIGAFVALAVMVVVVTAMVSAGVLAVGDSGGAVSDASTGVLLLSTPWLLWLLVCLSSLI
ncbi:unnamed protein product [Parascedosporium putredinis]|uniref:Uncharacterized protein n=1 Tax=Parascedosporium putredinis TaxID=1442378 RepID=A0A9P1H4U6_9PEZI|nr:unnamed protein product [Parascedosporium putredinis]CAI7996945.1 unnamed protein product [Parascedosporium putredinis]